MIIIINISTMKIEIEIKNCLKLYKIKKVIRDINWTMISAAKKMIFEYFH